MSPKLVVKEEKRKQIARAALGVFSKKGYTATIVREIATAAGMGKGTLYEYFPTKADIFVAAAKYWLNQLEVRFSIRLGRSEDPAKRLMILSQAFAELVDPLDSANARMSVEVIREAALEEGVLFNRRFEMREMMRGTQQMVEQVILDGISRGTFKPEIAEHVDKIAVNFIAYLDGILLHSVITQKNFDLKENVDFYMNTLIHSISNLSAGSAQHGTVLS